MNIEILKKINSEYPEKQIPFLHKMNRNWGQSKPLKGVKILHNLLNSYETLHKLEALIHAGAELTVCAADWVTIPDQELIDKIIIESGIRFIPCGQDLEGEFDIGLDCAARILRMKNVRIKKGIVELTRTGAIDYKKAKPPYPVVSIDDSNLKNLECMYGTAEAFIRAFKELTGQKIPNKKFVIFGYGKIGQGLVKYLSEYTDNIIIFENDAFALELANKRGLKAYSVHMSSLEMRKIVHDAYAIITATGVPKLLSQYLTEKDIGDSYIANMGVDDEIGDQFSSENKQVLFKKFPINFSLKHPTLMKYLDPVFYAHNLAAEQILNGIYPQKKFYPLDFITDENILQEWVTFFGEKIDDISENLLLSNSRLSA